MADFEMNLNAVLSRVKDLMIERHAKYGEGNISRHGMVGIVVRLGDKMARLEQGLEDHDDETLLSTLDDIAGYGLIGLMWELGLWPGSPHVITTDGEVRRVASEQAERWKGTLSILADAEADAAKLPENDQECSHEKLPAILCGGCYQPHLCATCFRFVGECPKGEGLDLAPDFKGLGQ